MSEFFAMGGDGPYVWSAFGITLAVLIWNIWSARSRLTRKLREAAADPGHEEPSRRAKVSQL
jgi:heme exporter protein CcmD